MTARVESASQFKYKDWHHWPSGGGYSAHSLECVSCQDQNRGVPATWHECDDPETNSDYDGQSLCSRCFDVRLAIEMGGGPMHPSSRVPLNKWVRGRDNVRCHDCRGPAPHHEAEPGTPLYRGVSLCDMHYNRHRTNRVPITEHEASEALALEFDS